MFQISTDISSLSVEQRKAFAAFVLSFPTSNSVPFEEREDPEPTALSSFSVYEDEQSPEEAFAPGPVLVSAVTIPAPPVTTSELDKTGIPWDSRIHTSSRAKNTDGSWRRRRGIDDAVAAQVEGELKALMGIPSPAPPPVAVIVPAPPPPPPGPVAVPPVAARTPSDTKAYIELVGKASAAYQAKKITKEQIDSCVASVGVESLQLLIHRLDLIPAVTAAIDLLIAS